MSNSEKDKCNHDLLMYGQAFMKDGKHIPMEDVYIKTYTEAKHKADMLALLDEVDDKFFKVFMQYHGGDEIDSVELLNLGKRTINAIRKEYLE